MLNLFDMDYRDRLELYGEDAASYVANLRDTVFAQLAEMGFQLDSVQTQKMLTLISQNAVLTFNEPLAEADFKKRFAEEVKKQKQDFSGRELEPSCGSI